MNATKQMFPVVADMKKTVKRMTGEDARTLLSFVSRLEGILSAINPRPKRILWPKEFTITRRNDQICLQERILDTDQPPLYCYGSYYQAISRAVAIMNERGQEFDLETLIDESQKINPRVTKPAVKACVRFWMSIERPLFEKNVDTNLYAACCDNEDFVNEAVEEWKAVSEKKLVLIAPRKIQ